MKFLLSLLLLFGGAAASTEYYYTGEATECWSGYDGYGYGCGPVQAQVRTEGEQISYVFLRWAQGTAFFDFINGQWTPSIDSESGFPVGTPPFAQGDADAFLAYWKTWDNLGGGRLELADGRFSFDWGELVSLHGPLVRRVSVDGTLVLLFIGALWFALRRKT